MKTAHPRMCGRLITTVLMLLTAPAVWTAESTKEDRSELKEKLEAAQARLDAAAREVADLSMSLSEDVMPRVMSITSIPYRAALGVNIGSGDGDSKSEGVEIISVSPGGAAAQAGLQAGDILTEINGKSLKRDNDRSPRSKLLAAMRELEPDEKISVKYLRGGKAATVSVTPGPVGDRFFSFRMPRPAVQAGRFSSGPNIAFLRADNMFGNAELVPLTPKLGQYFGTEKGLLVVRAPNDASMKLEEGDVILDIGGRVPANPAHALRILGSYQPGEKLQLNVLRMKKRMSLDVTMPEDRMGRWEERLQKWQNHLEHNPFQGFDTAGFPGVPVPPPAPLPATVPLPSVGVAIDDTV